MVAGTASTLFFGVIDMFVRRITLQRITCILLVFVLLVMLFCGPFVSSAYALAIYDDIAIAVLIAFGGAIGVTLFVEGYSATEVSAAVKDLVQDFLAYIGVASISVWLQGTQISFVSGLFNLPSLVVDAFSSFWAWVADGAPKADTSQPDPTPAPTLAPDSRPTTMPSYSILSESVSQLPSQSITSGYVLVTGISSYPALFSVAMARFGKQFVIPAGSAVSAKVNQWVSSRKSSGYACISVAYSRSSNSNAIYLVSDNVSVGDYVLLNNSSSFASLRLGYSKVENADYYIITSAVESNITLARFVGYVENVYGYDVVSAINASTITSSVSSSATEIDYPVIQDSANEAGYIDVLGIPDTSTLDEATDDVMDYVVNGSLVATIEISDVAPVTPTPVPPTPTVSPGFPPDLPLIPDTVLTSKFPFSIPSDLLSLITALSAEPEAPIISWNLNSMGIDYVVEIDLSEWDTVASICRTCEYVLFLVGLAVATRRIYLRG